MIQIQAFDIKKFAAANKFLKAHRRQLIAKDYLRFVGTTNPSIVVTYNDALPNSVQDQCEGLEIELDILIQQRGEYDRQLKEHLAIQSVFPEKSNQWNEHEETIKNTRKMIEIQDKKVEVLRQVISSL